MIRFCSLNLRHGGGLRQARIVDALLHHNSDVAVLTEYRNGPSGDKLASLLLDAGYAYQIHGAPPLGVNAVLVASRRPLLEAPLQSHYRLLSFQFAGLQVMGVYLPLDKPKLRFWTDYFQPSLDALAVKPALVIGDFNTGTRLDRQGVRFVAEDRFEANLASGWTSAWHAANPDKQEFSWHSHTKNGFLVDHAWLSAPAKERLVGAFLSHEERTTGVTDHAALVVDLTDA